MIVSCYFDIPSKKSHEFYKPHLSRFLGLVESPIVFFTTPDLKNWIQSMRPSHLPIHFMLYDSIYEIDMFKKYGLDFWKGQCAIDPEKYHTPELGALWANKKDFVLRAIEDTKLDEPYIWADAGSQRGDHWCVSLPTFGRNLKWVPRDKIIVQLMEPKVPEKDFFRWPDIYVAGAIMAAYKDVWVKYKEEYEKTLDEYVRAGVCANMDQYVMASTLLRCPGLIQGVYDDCLHPIIDRWYSFLKYLSFMNS
jgi:hypothetical protein